MVGFLEIRVVFLQGTVNVDEGWGYFHAFDNRETQSMCLVFVVVWI